LLKYPPFNNSDYACLKSPLTAAEFCLKLEALEDRKASLELERQQVEAQSKCSLLSVKESVLNDVASIIRTCDQEQRRVELGGHLMNLKTCLSRGGIANDRRRHSSAEILRLYARFDVDAFAADLDHYIAASGDGQGLRESLQKITGSIGRATREINAHWEKVEDLFHTIPLNWRDHRVGVPEHSPEREQALQRERRRMAERILRAFVRDWRDRAGMFEVPVTVNGIAIHTLPAHRRADAQQAYEKLQLGQIPKKPCYKFIVCLEPARKPEEAPVPHPLFTKEGVNAEMA
jgi:hypothetical protein